MQGSNLQRIRESFLDIFKNFNSNDTILEKRMKEDMIKWLNCTLRCNLKARTFEGV